MKIDYAKAREYALACKESYKPSDQQQFAGVAKPIHIEDKSTDTQCQLLVSGNEMTIVFRGSNSLKDWIGNFDIKQVARILNATNRSQTYPYAAASKSDVQLHRGFSDAYQSVRQRIHEQIKQLGVTHITVTGHSLGGALAMICVVDVQFNFSEQLQALQIYTFGAPRVGNRAFKESYERRVPHSYRCVNGHDWVVDLPHPFPGYPAHLETKFSLGQKWGWRLLLAPLNRDHGIGNYIKALEDKVTT